MQVRQGESLDFRISQKPRQATPSWQPSCNSVSCSPLFWFDCRSRRNFPTGLREMFFILIGSDLSIVNYSYLTFVLYMTRWHSGYCFAVATKIGKSELHCTCMCKYDYISDYRFWEKSSSIFKIHWAHFKHKVYQISFQNLQYIVLHTFWSGIELTTSAIRKSLSPFLTSSKFSTSTFSFRVSSNRCM